MCASFILIPRCAALLGSVLEQELARHLLAQQNMRREGSPSVQRLIFASRPQVNRAASLCFGENAAPTLLFCAAALFFIARVF